MHKIPRKVRMSALFAGLTAMTASAAVLQRNFPIPSPSGFADTESSSCSWMGTPDDLSRRFTLTLETVPSTNGCVQVAFGVDRNHDEDLHRGARPSAGCCFRADFGVVC